MKLLTPVRLNIVLISIILVGLISQNSLFIALVTILATIPIIYSAIRFLINRKITVDLLASIALTVSILHQEWISAAFINLMITFARTFGDYTEKKTVDAIQSLLKLRSETVKIKTDNSIQEIPSSEVKVGQIIIVESGDRIAIDGKVVSGLASVDQSSLTGESLPLAKAKGDLVYSSTLNLSGTIQVKAEKVGKDTSLEKIISLMKSAQNQKISIKPLIDNFTT